MKTIKQFSESKAAEKGERDVGSKAYTDYVIDLTPGAVSSKDAKKSDRETKKTNALKIHRATRLDDATDPEVVQANDQYKREKETLRKQHIKNVADIRANKIGENLVPDPVSADVYNYKTKKGAIAAPGSGSIAKARKAKTSDLNKSIEQQMVDARKEGWQPLDPSDVLIEYDKEEEVVEEDSTYSERISGPVPAGNLSGAKGSSKEMAKKTRKYKQLTPGQVRDYEKLSANRMFQAYEESEVDEDAPANNTSGVANWDPLLGNKRSPTIYIRKRRKIDARTKDYREAIKRTQARRDASVARNTEHKLNMFGVQSNPFKEETEMKNKKYLTTKEGSIEAAVLQSLTTETPVNPNDARPTLHLPNKYLASKAGSLERAVTEVVTEGDVSGQMRFDIKRLTGPQFRSKYRMTKAAAQTAGGGITHKGGKAVLSPHREEVEEMDENGNHPPKGPHKHKLPRQLKDKKKEKMVGTPSGTKVVDRNDPRYAKHPEHESVEMDEKDSRRTVDAIRAYDKSKDASRDADWDTEHGKKGKGDKEKKYAKKERGEIGKDDPDWKHKKGHTGMHGEETEMSALSSALIAATVNKISMEEDKLSYKERQGLPKGDFALPGKGSGPEGKQGGSYPIPDASHARNALARVSQHGSEAEKATVRRAVHKKFPDIKVAEGVMRDLLTVKLEEGNVKGKGEWMPWAGKHATGETKKKPEVKTKTAGMATKPLKSVFAKKEEVEVDEIHSPKDRAELDKAVADYKKGDGKTTVLKPGSRLKGMPKKQKALVRARKEEVEIDEDHSPKEIENLQKQKARQREKYVAAKKIARQNTAKMNPEEVELDEIGIAQAARIASAKAIARGREKEKEADERELALKKNIEYDKARQAAKTKHMKKEEVQMEAKEAPDQYKFVDKKKIGDKVKYRTTMRKKGGRKMRVGKVTGISFDKFGFTKYDIDRGVKTIYHQDLDEVVDVEEKIHKKEEVEIHEAQSVDSAIGVIDSIVKNKQAGEIIHGDRKKSKVDLYTASAIQAVMKKVNKSNQQKMEKLMSHSRKGLAKVADLSFSLMKK